jgi:hypothetical protein
LVVLLKSEFKQHFEKTPHQIPALAQAMLCCGFHCQQGGPVFLHMNDSKVALVPRRSLETTWYSICKEHREGIMAH